MTGRFILSSSAGDIGENLEQAVETIKTTGFSQIWGRFFEDARNFLPTLAAALVFFAAALLAVYFIDKLIRHSLKRSKVEKALHYFIATLVKYMLLGVSLIAFIGLLGFPLTPVVTALGAIGLAFSLAVKDSLSNLAGGVFMLFNCPFRTGDYIELKGVSGTVREIRLTYTVLQTTYNRSIFIPNSDFSKATITNYSMSETRCMELSFSVKPEEGIDRAKTIIIDALKESGMILENPGPVVRVSDQTDVAVKLTCMAWVEPDKLFDLKAFVIQRVRENLLTA